MKEIITQEKHNLFEEKYIKHMKPIYQLSSIHVILLTKF